MLDRRATLRLRGKELRKRSNEAVFAVIAECAVAIGVGRTEVEDAGKRLQGGDGGSPAAATP